MENFLREGSREGCKVELILLGQPGGILEKQEANISDHLAPFLMCFGKSNLHFPAFPPQSLWIWVCELDMNLVQVPTVFSSSQ